MKTQPIMLPTGVEVATSWQLTSKTMAQEKMNYVLPVIEQSLSATPSR